MCFSFFVQIEVINNDLEFIMPKITYITFDGIKHTVDVPVGLTVMEGARDNNIPGLKQIVVALVHALLVMFMLIKIG